MEQNSVSAGGPVGGADRNLKEITHLRHFFENIVINFQNTVFFILFSETLIISQTNSCVSQNNIKYKSEFE